MKSLLRTEHKNTEPFFRFGGGKGVVFYFYPGKDTELLTHSFSRFAVFFFLESTKFRLIRFEPVNLELPSNWPKK